MLTTAVRWGRTRSCSRGAGTCILVRQGRSFGRVARDYDEPALVVRLAALPRRAQAVFAAACASRLFSACEAYAAIAPEWDLHAARSCEQALWLELEAAEPRAERLTELQISCRALIPADAAGQSIWESGAAEDAMAALTYAARAATVGSGADAGWAARRAWEATYGKARQRMGLRPPRPSDANHRAIVGSPIVQRELARQQRDLAELEATPSRALPACAVQLHRRAREEAADALEDLD